MTRFSAEAVRSSSERFSFNRRTILLNEKTNSRCSYLPNGMACMAAGFICFTLSLLLLIGGQLFFILHYNDFRILINGLHQQLHIFFRNTDAAGCACIVSSLRAMQEYG